MVKQRLQCPQTQLPECVQAREMHMHTPLLGNALLMINDHNENVHTSLSSSQVLHRDKHDKNKGCPMLGSIFFLLSAGLFTLSPQEWPIFGSLATFHTQYFSL